MENQYYNENANKYYKSTYNLEVEELYRPFLSYIPQNGYILDAGCGSGRDSKNFLVKDYIVSSFDI